jgi:hypothetical protein
MQIRSLSGALSYDNLSSVSQNVLKIRHGKNPIFHHIKSNNSGMTKVKIVKNERDPSLFTGKLLINFQNILRNTRMITWVVFLRMFWNFISSLPVKRGGSLSFLIGTISNVLVMEIGWTDVGSGGDYVTWSKYGCLIGLYCLLKNI